MKTKKLLLIALSSLTLMSCKFNYKVKSDFTYKDDNVIIIDNLEQVENKKAHVVLLYGQSNADGVSHNEYLERNDSAKYSEYLAGYDNVRINFYNDGGNNSSSYAFQKITLGCGCAPTTFGPEMGIADIFSKQYPDEETFIIKWTWGGTTLANQWLNGVMGRGDLYNSAMDFSLKCLSYLKDKGYLLSMDGICWMQGENDSCYSLFTPQYYKNTCAFVTLLRHDLSEYSKEIRFVDAGINEEEDIWPRPKEINEAKKKFANESKLNIYIDPTELGLTAKQEPEGQVDYAHFDSLSMVKLGQEFGKECAK